MTYKKILFISLIIVLAVALVSIVSMYNLSEASRYCPLLHKINPDMFCKIHDSLNEKVLVEHFNRDTNELELSIFGNEEMIWIQHPYGELNNYHPSIETNTILFDRNNPSSLIVNDSTFSITVLDKH